MQIGTVQGIIWCAKSGLDRLTKRRTEQYSAVIPTSLVECGRLDAGLSEPFSKSEPMQEARSVRADIDAGTHFTERCCLLVDMHIETCAQHRQCGCQTTYPGADDPNRHIVCHDSLRRRVPTDWLRLIAGCSSGLEAGRPPLGFDEALMRL
jgi:hypothetical protein